VQTGSGPFICHTPGAVRLPLHGAGGCRVLQDSCPSESEEGASDCRGCALSSRKRGDTRSLRRDWRGASFALLRSHWGHVLLKRCSLSPLPLAWVLREVISPVFCLLALHPYPMYHGNFHRPIFLSKVWVRFLLPLCNILRNANKE
jgi:hypothetical protein